MKKILAFLLAALMVMSFAACGTTDSNSTEAPTEAPTENLNEAPVGSEITSFSISIMSADGTFKGLSAYGNEEGGVYVEMNDTIIKKGDVDSSAWTAIANAFAASDLKKLESSPDDEYSDDMASISVSYADETYFFLTRYGELPEEFTTGYAAMVACFTELTADIPEYVAKPLENGEIADSDRAALNDILANLELYGSADTYTISAFPKDENFAFNMFLSTTDGVATGLQFATQMTTNAYALNIVTLEEGADANAVAANFESGINWRRWICVQPESAYIAIKDNQVLMLLGTADFYDNTVTAIEAAGWTAYKTLSKPDFEGDF